jgi:hypothetical protein
MSTPSRQPLPAEWTDRLFGRLAVRYGHEWLRLWEGLDMAAVKADWQQQLGGMHLTPEAQDRLRYGLDNLPPDRPPTVAVFKAICNRAPVNAPPALVGPTPSVDPQRVALLREKLAEAFAAKHPRAWAHRLKERHEAGERLSLAQIDMYQSALAARRGELGVSDHQPHEEAAAWA